MGGDRPRPARWDRTQGRPEPIRALNRVREVENHEPLVDIREVAPSVRILRPAVIPFLRRRVVEMMEEASSRLPEGVYLGVIDAFRPIDRQRRIYEFVTNSALEVWPDLTYAQLKRKVNRWVAPVDQKAPPGHCTGAAVDVNLVNEAGEVLDVWSPFTRFLAAPTFTIGLDPEAHRLRMALFEAMVGVGFSNCRDEWWHYSYGDAGWAVRIGVDECFYGLIELEPEHYEEQEALWMEAFQERQNPFLHG